MILWEGEDIRVTEIHFLLQGLKTKGTFKKSLLVGINSNCLNVSTNNFNL